MIKIGDFSKLSRVPVKTLRFYDEMGLLRPVEVDRFTGYRYYSAEQMPRLNRILALKDLGLTLQQIAQVLDEGLSADQLRGMLRLKQAELRQELEAEAARLARVEARLNQIELEGKMPDYEIVLKQIEPQLVASVQGVIPDYPNAGPVFDRLFDEVYNYVHGLDVRRTGSAIALYPDPEYREQDINVEAAVEIYEPIAGSDRVKVYELPGVANMACTIHHGPFTSLSQGYSALMKWVEANGYQPAGPIREVYLQYQRGGDPADYVTEIQFPVTKP